MSKQTQMRSVVIILIVIALVLAAIVSLFVAGSDEEAFDSGRIGGDFVLHSNSGPVSLQQFRGKLVLLFFGYTHCPDVCPTTMNHVAEALDLLSEGERAKVQPLFITVDPMRDSVEHLSRYVAFFHPKIIGLSGSMDEIRQVAEKYSVEFFSDEGDRQGDSYLVSHASYLFLINTQGEVSDMMSDHTAPADIAEALRRQIPRS